ncbi:MAG: hypothetical protein EBX72_02140 [Betaproteobacteria bacterium]|nr:hypothetical protein [Betaproteobacteria bacterium]
MCLPAGPGNANPADRSQAGLVDRSQEPVRGQAQKPDRYPLTRSGLTTQLTTGSGAIRSDKRAERSVHIDDVHNVWRGNFLQQAARPAHEAKRKAQSGLRSGL